MDIIFHENGNTHHVKNSRDMLMAIGLDNRREVYITNEQGQLIGAGYGVEGAQGSQPILKALREGKPLMKSVKGPEQRLFFNRSVNKPKSLAGGLDALIQELNTLHKSMQTT